MKKQKVFFLFSASDFPIIIDPT